MQYLYAYETTQQLPASHFIAHLEKSILSVKEQYLNVLLIIREIANFVEQDAKVKASKHIKSEKDKNFNTKLLSNVIIQYLNNDKEFDQEIKKANIQSLIDEDAIRRFYKILFTSDAYIEYLNNGLEFNVEADKKILTYLLNSILLEDDVFNSLMEENFTNWIDDAEYVVEAVQEVINKSKNELKLHLEKGSIRDKFKELTQFGIDLFSEVSQQKEAHANIITPKLKNWEADRLAVIDVILIRMAVAEFLHFPSIPVKVTINEYLDIAKEYSTAKSKDFINGVLDAIMKDLKKNDQIQKVGRGLL